MQVDRGRRICLVTTSQPSANPRLVKEADALVEIGYQVHVVAAHRYDWAARSDRTLIAGRPWTMTLIDWRRDVAPWLFWKTRARHFLARGAQTVPGAAALTVGAAIDRLAPELQQAATRVRADLYIAHNAGALPAAAAAARAHHGLLGFDAEDYHSGEFADGDRSPLRLAVERVERRFIPRCDYITAASPGIADAYASLSRVGRPRTILNVFPLSMRPSVRQSGSMSGPLRVYWFSQTIGADRGLEDIVRAMGRLAGGSVELHLRGQWAAGYNEHVRRVATEAGVAAHSIVSHAPAPADDMARLAASYDVGLATETGRVPNRQITLTNKVFTYLLAGLATLVTSTRAQAELAAGLGMAAQSYHPGDVDAAAAALKTWAADRSLLEAARQTAWAAGETRYNWDVEKHEYLGAIEGVFSARSDRAPTADALAMNNLHA